MSGWTIFAVCYTVLLLAAGSAFTLFSFYRADRRLRKAELKARGARARSRGAEAL